MSLFQALPAVEYSSNIREWQVAQMVPDLAILALIATYVGLVIYDMASSWSIELKSRQQGLIRQIGQMNKTVAPGATAAASAPTPIKRFRTRTSLALMVFELCLCGFMLGAVAIWYYYVTILVQDDIFSTRSGPRDMGP